MCIGPHSDTLLSVDALSEDQVFGAEPNVSVSSITEKFKPGENSCVSSSSRRLSGSSARTGRRTSICPGTVPAEICRRQQQEAVCKLSAVSEVWSPTATRGADRLRLLLLLLQVLKLELKEIREQQDLLFRFMNFLKQEGAVHVLQFCLTVGKNTVQSLA